MAELQTVLLSSLLADDKAITVGVMYPGEDTPMGVPLIRVADIVGGRISSTIGYRISEKVNSQYRRTHLSGDEVLMTLVGRPGTAIKVPAEMRGWNAARALAVLRLADPDERDFFVYSVASPQVQHTIRNWCNTTVQATLNLKEIKALPLPWPDRTTRQSIAATLGALDDKIELNRKMNATLEAMARALFRDWFVDFGPTRAKMALSASGAKNETDPRAPTLSPDLWSLFPARLDDEGKPEGWEMGQISDQCLRVESGGTPSRKKPKYWDGGTFPWLTSGEVRQPIITETENHITKLGLEESSAKIWPSLSVVVAMYGATAGQVTLLACETSANQACCALIPKQHARSFVFLKAKISIQIYEKRARGSAQQNLNKTLVSSLEIVSPPKPILERFEKAVSPLVERMIKNDLESRTLAQTRDLLLPRLMSGELRVASAEQAVEAVL